MADSPGFKARLPKIALGVALVLALVAGLWFVLKALGTKDNKPARTVQTIQVIRPPPPPPPDEKPPPPPPPEKVEHFEQSQPDPTPTDEPAPSEDLALDAAGTAGGDAFGLAARPGGRDITGGSGTAPFGWYQNRLASQLSEKLSADPKLKGKKFTVSVRVWIDHDGRIKEVAVSNGTGDSALDSAVQAAISGMQKFAEAPPMEMPQPVTLRIVRKS